MTEGALFSRAEDDAGPAVLSSGIARYVFLTDSVCVCVCVRACVRACVCERERERDLILMGDHDLPEANSKSEREKKKVGDQHVSMKHV